MKIRIVASIGIILMIQQLAMADASYEHTSQITGGQFVNMLKNFAIISKQMKQMTEPTSEITMVHGNQKAIVSKDYTEIWDLDKEQIIHIDNTKKSYSVMTFADMRKALQEMPAKMAQMQQQLKDEQAKAQKQQQGQTPTVPPNLQFSTSVDVKDTGVTKMIEKYNAKQQIMTMKLIVTDTNNPGTNITYSFTDEIWTTPDVPAEMKDVQEFDKRFGEKMMQGMDVKDLMANMANMRNGSQMAMMQMFGAKPGAGDAFAQMQKELAKITGTRLIEITRMGGSGTGIEAQPGTPAGGSPGQTSNGSTVAGQVATNTAQNTASATAGDATSHVGGIGGVALGSAVSGALGGVFGHKKAKPATPPPAPAADASATPAAPAPTDVTLMEMTAKTHDFSTEAIPSSVFQIPSGFKQVESPMEQMMNKK
jgi:hypothetical protein